MRNCRFIDLNKHNTDMNAGILLDMCLPIQRNPEPTRTNIRIFAFRRLAEPSFTLPIDMVGLFSANKRSGSSFSRTPFLMIKRLANWSLLLQPSLRLNRRRHRQSLLHFPSRSGFWFIFFSARVVWICFGPPLFGPSFGVYVWIFEEASLTLLNLEQQQCQLTMQRVTPIVEQAVGEHDPLTRSMTLSVTRLCR